MDKYSFQNCQKLVVFSADDKSVLLAKRKGEQDYDGVFSFIGGKMEITDESIIAGLKREKDEEVGEGFKVALYTTFHSSVLFLKKNGSYMLVPHYYARHIGGEVLLSDEYSEYQWVPIEKLDAFEPKIPNIPERTRELLRLRKIMKDDEFVEI